MVNAALSSDLTLRQGLETHRVGPGQMPEKTARIQGTQKTGDRTGLRFAKQPEVVFPHLIIE